MKNGTESFVSLGHWPLVGTIRKFSRRNTGFWRQHAMGWWSRLWGQINTF